MESREPSDEELARRAAGGDGSAFAELVERYDARLAGFLRPKTPPGWDAADLAQEVWAKVLDALPAWKDGHFRGWLFQIARNAAADARRRPRFAQADDAILLSVAGPTAAADPLADLVPRLRQCLDLLRQKKPDFHTAVVRQMAGATLDDIATEQAVPLNTAKTRIRRGKDALRGCVGGPEA